MITEKTKAILAEVRFALLASKTRKILFDHLPKCGGTSLKVYLRAQYPSKKVFSIDGLNPTASLDKFKKLSRNKRHGYDLVEGHCANDLLGYVHPNSLKITMLRDPVERIISHFFYVKRTPKHYLHSIVVSSAMDLEQFVTSGISAELSNWYTSHFSLMSAEEVERQPDRAVAKAFDFVSTQYDIIGFLNDYSGFVRQVAERAKFRYANEKEKKMSPWTVRRVEIFLRGP
jgi:hypothetical protein